jgi:hypothetical protein
VASLRGHRRCRHPCPDSHANSRRQCARQGNSGLGTGVGWGISGFWAPAGCTSSGSSSAGWRPGIARLAQWRHYG